MTNQQIRQQADLLHDYVVQCRRTIHRFAEPSGTEAKTSAFVQQELKAAGLPYEMVSTHGLIATLETGRPGPHIALRADLDALPVPEEPNNLAGPRICVSSDPCTSHACGHDAHTAMLLGAVKALVTCRDTLNGVLYFCFEEGEEDGRGTPGMLNALSKRTVDTCWAIHVYAGLESGKICVEPGPRMAGAVSIDLTVVGRGGHGSRPDMSANPVYCAAAILTNMSTAWVNQITAGETVTLGITSIQGGVAANVIPDTAKMIGSLRYFSLAEGEKALRIFNSVAEHTAAMNNCHVEYGPLQKIACKPVINDAGFAAIAKERLPEVLPAGCIASCEPWYASEAWSEYALVYPCVMAHLGINNPAYGSGAAHHNGFFDVDEGVLDMGLLSTLKYIAAVGEKSK